jgi:DNA-binding GntR family transcriptional regulator
MTTIQPIQDNSTLPEKVAEQLRAMIIRGELAPSVQLPTEPALSRAMHVSRSTLRAALDSLAREGVVVRKRGVGTFVSEQPLAANNLNLNWGVTEVIRATGATPGTTDLKILTSTADERLAARLELPADTPLMVVERVRLADARRVVFSRDFFPLALLGANDSMPALEAYLLQEHSLYGFLKHRLDLDFHHAVAWLRPVTADADLAGRLQILPGSGMLYIEQVDYDSDGVPLVLADEFHVAEAFTFTVYRSRLAPGAAASERDN